MLPLCCHYAGSHDFPRLRKNREKHEKTEISLPKLKGSEQKTRVFSRKDVSFGDFITISNKRMLRHMIMSFQTITPSKTSRGKNKLPKDHFGFSCSFNPPPPVQCFLAKIAFPRAENNNPTRNIVRGEGIHEKLNFPSTFRFYA